MVHLCVWMDGCKMGESERYLWHFGLFLVLFILTLKGDVVTILEVYWGVGGYPSSQMWEILLVFGIMSKTHLSGFWPYYLLF